jgi:hypothetical protein
MELKSQPFPHLSPTTEALCRPEAAVLPGDMAALTAGVDFTVEELAVFMVEAVRAEAVLTEAVLTEAVEEAAPAEVVHTEEAEAPVAEAPVEAPVLQAGVAVAAIARVKTRNDQQ